MDQIYCDDERIAYNIYIYKLTIRNARKRFKIIKINNVEENVCDSVKYSNVNVKMSNDYFKI